MGADIDEHRIGRQASGGRQYCNGGVDLASLPSAMPHQPGADHPIRRIDEQTHIAELAEHEVPARRERPHDGVAQHRSPDQQRLEQRAPQGAPAAMVGSAEPSPSVTPTLAPRCQVHV
jgi:hypothetical protein